MSSETERLADSIRSILNPWLPPLSRTWTPVAVHVASHSRGESGPSHTLDYHDPTLTRLMPHLNRFVIRTYHRIPVRCQLYYMGGEFLGKGTVMNLSRTGLRVLGDHQVVPGMEFSVRLSLPDKDEPVEIQRVVVQWVQEQLFGVKFLTISADAEERLGNFMSVRLRSYCASV